MAAAGWSASGRTAQRPGLARRLLLVSAVGLAGLLAAALVAAGPVDSPMAGGAVAGACTLLGAAVLRLAQAPGRARRRPAALPAILAAASARILDAPDGGALALAVREAAEAIVARHGGGGIVVALSDGRLLRAASVTEGMRAGDVTPRDLPAELLAALSEGHQSRADGPILGVSGPRGARSTLDLLPLRTARGLHGILAVDRRRTCPGDGTCPCGDALTVLAGQASAALGLLADAREAGARQQRFETIVHRNAEAVLIVDADGSLRYGNAAATALLGYPPAMLERLGLAGVMHAEDLPAWRAFFAACTAPEAGSAAPSDLRCRLQHADRSLRTVEVLATDLRDAPSVGGIVLAIRDVTRSTQTEAALAHQASHDPLTDLPNRALLLERIQEALLSADRRRRMAVLFIDLDGFKAVNDRLGHAGGDALLVHVADRLRGALRAATCVARLSGDEFAVLLEGLPPLDQAREAEAIGRRILSVLEAPTTVQREEVRIRASIGIAVGANGTEDAGDLLHRADLAMYDAKAAGKGRCTVFDLATHETHAGQLQLQSELRGALDRDELEVRYQPLVSLKDGRIVSTEALVRWHHPKRGLLGPGTFIPLAEDEGLVGEIFDLVLTRACRQVRRWQERLGLAAPNVAVNLSPRQLHEPGLPDRVAAVLRDARIPPSCLTLELTENVLLADPHAAATVMRALKDIGVRLAIDDFGTGYSSLAYLRALPIDVLKVDKTFIDGLGSRDPSGLLARTIVDLGRRLGLQTVAEGIERQEQADLLREFGCDYGQGYLFARPLIGGAVDELITARVQEGAGIP